MHSTPFMDINNSLCLNNLGQEVSLSFISSVMVRMVSSKVSINADQHFILRSYWALGSSFGLSSVLYIGAHKDCIRI